MGARMVLVGSQVESEHWISSARVSEMTRMEGWGQQQAAQWLKRVARVPYAVAGGGRACLSTATPP